MGAGDDDYYAVSITDSSHRSLVDCIAIVSDARTKTGSTESASARLKQSPAGCALGRYASPPQDLAGGDPLVRFRFAGQTRDHEGRSIVASGGHPGLLHSGCGDLYPVVLCVEKRMLEVARCLRTFAGVKNVLQAHAGGPARLVEEP